MGARWGKGDMLLLDGNLFEIVCCALMEMGRPHLALAAVPFAFVAKATQVTIIIYMRPYCRNIIKSCAYVLHTGVFRFFALAASARLEPGVLASRRATGISADVGP